MTECCRGLRWPAGNRVLRGDQAGGAAPEPKGATCPTGPVGGKVELSVGDEVIYVDAAQGGVRVDVIVTKVESPRRYL